MCSVNFLVPPTQIASHLDSFLSDSPRVFVWLAAFPRTTGWTGKPKYRRKESEDFTVMEALMTNSNGARVKSQLEVCGSNANTPAGSSGKSSTNVHPQTCVRINHQIFEQQLERQKHRHIGLVFTGASLLCSSVQYKNTNLWRCNLKHSRLRRELLLP